MDEGVLPVWASTGLAGGTSSMMVKALLGAGARPGAEAVST